MSNSRRTPIGQTPERLERLRRLLGLRTTRPSDLDRIDIPTIVWRVIVLLACLRVVAWVADWLEKIFPIGS